MDIMSPKLESLTGPASYSHIAARDVHLKLWSAQARHSLIDRYSLENLGCLHPSNIIGAIHVN